MKINDYSIVLKRVRDAVPHSSISQLGKVEGNGKVYTFPKIVLGNEQGKKVLITGGIHGDEPAGVESVCAFLEGNHFTPFLKDWHFTIVPCLNPGGYELGTRENHLQKDLNREFKLKDPSTEVILAQSLYNGISYDLSLELHEDVDSTGYYLFQKDRIPRDTLLGKIIIDQVEPIMEINRSEEIEDIPAEEGIISRLKEPDEMDWWPMAVFSYWKETKSCFTLETGTCFDMKTRVEAHLIALITALKEF